MNNSQYITLLRSIIENNTFVKKLKVQVQNFPNLKLENHIRNILVELTNIELNDWYQEPKLCFVGHSCKIIRPTFSLKMFRSPGMLYFVRL